MKGRRLSFASLAVGMGLAIGLAGVGLALLGSARTTPRVLVVGPGRRYTRPCQAFAAARAGDTVRIDAHGNRSYDGDVCAVARDHLTITGFNGRAHVDAGGRTALGKAIWVITGSNVTVRDVELSGAHNASRNGAGIRAEGTNLTLVNCFLHDNDEGLLAGANPRSNIVIDSSEFARNGSDGFAHNLYIGVIRSFTLRSSWSHDAILGHLVKSRALTNFVLYNRLTGQKGTDGYELDLPQGGRSYVIGNLIQQGAASVNPTMVAFNEESVHNPDSQLFLVNNTFVNDKGAGYGVVVGAATGLPVVAKNNLAWSAASFLAPTRASPLLAGNCFTTTPRFARPAAYDYRLLPGSPCIDRGVTPGTGQGYPLAPRFEYRYELGWKARAVHGAAIDAGAFEAGQAGG